MKTEHDVKIQVNREGLTANIEIGGIRVNEFCSGFEIKSLPGELTQLTLYLHPDKTMLDLEAAILKQATKEPSTVEND